jgi:hypothetical protein
VCAAGGTTWTLLVMTPFLVLSFPHAVLVTHGDILTVCFKWHNCNRRLVLFVLNLFHWWAFSVSVKKTVNKLLQNVNMEK